MGVQTLYRLGPQPLSRTGSRAACVKITLSDIGLPNCKKYYVNFTVCTQFTNVAAGRTTQPGGPRFGDPSHNLDDYSPHSNILTCMCTMHFKPQR